MKGLEIATIIVLSVLCHSRTVLSECGGAFTGLAGNFFSPQLNEKGISEGDGTDCAWTITVNASQVNITSSPLFLAFNLLEIGPQDSLLVRGEGKDGPIIAELNGLDFYDSLLLAIQFNTTYINYKYAKDSIGRGFKASYNWKKCEPLLEHQYTGRISQPVVARDANLPLPPGPGNTTGPLPTFTCVYQVLYSGNKLRRSPFKYVLTFTTLELDNATLLNLTDHLTNVTTSLNGTALPRDMFIGAEFSMTVDYSMNKSIASNYTLSYVMQTNLCGREVELTDAAPNATFATPGFPGAASHAMLDCHVIVTSPPDTSIVAIVEAPAADPNTTRPPVKMEASVFDSLTFQDGARRDAPLLHVFSNMSDISGRDVSLDGAVAVSSGSGMYIRYRGDDVTQSSVFKITIALQSIP